METAGSELNGLLRAASKSNVEADGDPNPLPVRRVCQYMSEWTFVNLSGTAIIRFYYRLKH